MSCCNNNYGACVIPFSCPCPINCCVTGTTGVNTCCQTCSPCGQICNPCGNSCRRPCRRGCKCSKCKPDYSSDSDCEKRSHKNKKKRCSKCNKSRCCCINYTPCLQTRCGCISATLTKTASPTFYTAANQQITYTYTIVNTGTTPICFPIQICDNVLGGFFINCSFIPPCSGSQSFSRVYTTTAADLLVTSITNTASANIVADKCTYVCTNQATATITNGSADLFGSIVMTAGLASSIDVVVTISNSASSASAATNASLTLLLPANSGVITPGAPPPSSITPTAVVMNIPSLAIGATSTFRFNMLPTVTTSGSSYAFNGTITAATFDPIPSNNGVSATFTYP